MKKLVLSVVLMLAVVASLATGLTGAYFTDTRSEYVDVKTATLKVGDTYGFPLTFANLAPGLTREANASFKLNSTVDADVYVGLKHDSGVSYIGVLEGRIYREGVIDTGWLQIADFFSKWTKVADVAGGNSDWQTYLVQVRMKTDAGNTYQNTANRAILWIYATQDGAPAPATAPYLYSPS